MSCDELIFLVVSHEQGSKALQIAKNNGVREGTIFLGKGTASNKWLKLLDLSDIRREIVLMVADRSESLSVMDALCKELSLYKPYHGITYSVSMSESFGIERHEHERDAQSEKNKAVNDTMYNALFTIVDKGKAEDVIDAASLAGARGGTIINARGSSVDETRVIFAMPIEPEKEMVMILVERGITQSVVAAICQKLNIEAPGNGMLFVINVNEAHGLIK